MSGRPDTSIEGRLTRIDTILSRGVGPVGARDAIDKIVRLLTEIEREGGAPHDPIRELQLRIGDRWTTLLMFVLEAGPLRHSVLRRLVDEIDATGISQRMLTLRLRTLERDGFVDRREDGRVPPRVDYRLTALGQDFLALIHHIKGWTVERQRAIREAQAAFDGKTDDD